MKHNERYKSIQVNLSKSRHNYLISWLESKVKDEETSLNSIIVRAIKKQYEEDIGDE